MRYIYTKKIFKKILFVKEKKSFEYAEDKYYLIRVRLLVFSVSYKQDRDIQLFLLYLNSFFNLETCKDNLD